MGVSVATRKSKSQYRRENAIQRRFNRLYKFADDRNLVIAWKWGQSANCTQIDPLRGVITLNITGNQPKNDPEEDYDYHDPDSDCWRCGGEGWLDGEDLAESDPFWYDSSEVYKCNCCGGSGNADDCTYW